MTDPRILLVNPSTPKLWDPRMLPMLGILYIAAVIRDWLGIKPQLWDMNYSGPLPEGYEADILMVTANSGTFSTACEVASKVKAPLKVVGGPHSTSLPKEAVGVDSPFNVAVVGEGEQTVYALISSFIEHYSVADLIDVEGIAVRIDGHVRLNRPRKFLDVNIIPWPAYELWPDLGQMSAVAARGSTAGPGCAIITSRGCPFECRFCNTDMWRRVTRFRYVEDVLNEVMFLQQRFGITHIRVQDDMVTLNKSRFAAFCVGMQRLGMKWRAHTRTDVVTRDDLQMMKDCGCVELGLGIESGSQKILDAMVKKNTVGNHANAITWANEVGLNTSAYLIVGFPGETWDTVRETVEFVRKVRPTRTTLSTFVPYPGCDVWQHPEAYEAVITSVEWDKYWLIGLEETDEGFILEFPSMSRKELVKARTYMLSEFEKMVGSRDRRQEIEC